jgi:hypothetical protein
MMRNFHLLFAVLLCNFLSIVRGLVIVPVASNKETTNAGGKYQSSRRSFLQQAIILGPAILPTASLAQEETESPHDRRGKPFAPLQALLPATRCKVWIDRAYALSSTLTASSDKNTQYDTLMSLKEILYNQPIVNESPQKRTSASMAKITAGVSYAKKDGRADPSKPAQLAAMLNQAGVEQQWGILKYGESKLEQGNELRAAFNCYSSQLQFADSYVLTASKVDKKRMVRNDQLPSLTAVIVSDLDLRDLYRNELLTAIEDAKAEASYQLKQTKDSVDASDVIDLMNQAHTACTKWFDLIAPRDVQEALQAVMNE